MRLSEKIRHARKKKSMSQQQVAFKVGVGRLHITEIEKGKRVPSVACLFKIFNILDMEPEKEALKVIFGIRGYQ